MTIKRNAIAGVTVQQHQVTMALLTEPLRAPKMISVAGVTQQPLAANVVEQGVWRDPQAVQVAIGRCQEALGGSIRRVVMCVADDAVVTARVPSPERVFAHQQQAALKEAAVQISPWPPDDPPGSSAHTRRDQRLRMTGYQLRSHDKTMDKIKFTLNPEEHPVTTNQQKIQSNLLDTLSQLKIRNRQI